jgi:hypothetical protein
MVYGSLQSLSLTLLWELREIMVIKQLDEMWVSNMQVASRSFWNIIVDTVRRTSRSQITESLCQTPINTIHLMTILIMIMILIVIQKCGCSSVYCLWSSSYCILIAGTEILISICTSEQIT